VRGAAGGGGRRRRGRWNSRVAAGRRGYRDVAATECA